MFVFLLTSMGARGFNSKEFSHDLDHHGQTDIVALDYAYNATLTTGENSGSAPLDEIAHQLLHAVSELHFLASTALSAPWENSARVLAPASSSPSLPVAALESPFRPPRRSAFI